MQASHLLLPGMVIQTETTPSSTTTKVTKRFEVILHNWARGVPSPFLYYHLFLSVVFLFCVSFLTPSNSQRQFFRIYLHSPRGLGEQVLSAWGPLLRASVCRSCNPPMVCTLSHLCAKPGGTSLPETERRNISHKLIASDISRPKDVSLASSSTATKKVYPSKAALSDFSSSVQQHFLCNNILSSHECRQLIQKANLNSASYFS